MTAQPQATPRDVADGIRRELATIRRHWPHTFDPPSTTTGGGSRDVPDSKLPSNDTAISLRAEVTRDLAFWVDAFIRAHPDAHAELLTEWHTIDSSDVDRTCRYLAHHATQLGAWTSGPRLWAELETLAREVRQVAAPPVRDTMPIGECPECGTVVRAKAHDPGNIRCKGCGTTDTIDGWIIRVVGNEPLVTAEQLIPILHKRMGIVATRARIRAWKARGVISAAEEDESGRTRYDRKTVFVQLAHYEAHT